MLPNCVVLVFPPIICGLAAMSRSPGDWFPNQHGQSRHGVPEPTFRCWLMLPFNSSRGVISWFRYLWGLRKRMCSGREREERIDKCAGETTVWIWKCSVIQGLNNSAQPWCLMPLLFHRPRQSELPSQHLGLESNERHQRRRVFLQVGEPQVRSGVMRWVSEEILWKQLSWHDG